MDHFENGSVDDPLRAGHGQDRNPQEGATQTVINYKYDSLYNISKIDFPSGTDIEFTILANGLRESMKDASGEKRYYYDMALRVIKVEQGPQGFVVGTNHNYVAEYAWNAASQCTQKKVTLRGQSAIVWGQTFTDDGNLDVVTDPASSQAKHEWLTDGRLKKITYKFETSDKKSTREFFYEDTNDSHAYVSDKTKFLRKTLDKKQAGTTICSFAYELDKGGIRQSVTNKDGKYEKFGYDPSYQLKSDTKWSAKIPGTRDYQYLYDYDPNGNRISKFANGVETAYEYGDNSELTDAGGAAWTYDHFGNAVTMGSTNVSYDFQGHALTISEISKGTDTHEYDGDGRRMRSKLNGASNWTHFVHDELSDSILVEYQAAPNPTAKAIYTYGIGLISSSITGVSPTKRWFHFDGLGSTAALTDANENITDTYEFSAFGVQENSAGSSVNPFRYVGEWGYYGDGARGSQYGLLLLGVRYYSRDVGRFLTWEPATVEAGLAEGEDGGDLYGYATNNPTTFTDPSGFNPQGPPQIVDPFRQYQQGMDRYLRQRVDAAAAKCRELTNCYTCLTDLYDKYGNIYHGSHGINNALRHCVGACAARRQCGKECAWAIFGHEWRSFWTQDSKYDVHNNHAGFLVADSKLTCYQGCKRLWDARLLCPPCGK